MAVLVFVERGLFQKVGQMVEVVEMEAMST